MDKKRHSSSPISLFFIIVILSLSAFMNFNKKEPVKEKEYLFNKDNLPRLDSSKYSKNIVNNIVYEFTGKNIDINYSNYLDGYNKLINNEIDIMIATKANNYIENIAKSKGIEFEYNKLYDDALVFYVNKNNKINNLSLKHLIYIYDGLVNNWYKLGSYNTNIILLQDLIDTETYNNLLNLTGNKLKKPSVYELQNNMIDYTKLNIGSIGYAYYSNIKDNNDIKILSINGIIPSKETIDNNTYPIIIPFYMVTRVGDNNTNVVKFKKELLAHTNIIK